MLNQCTHHSLGDGLHLFEERGLLAVATRGVDNDDFKAFLLEALHTFLGHAHGVTLRVAAKEGNLRLECVLLQLVHGTGAKRIGAN